MTTKAEKAEAEKQEAEKPEPLKLDDPVKSLRIDFDEATGEATAVPLTVDGEVAQTADGEDMVRLPEGASPLSWSTSHPGVVVTPDPEETTDIKTGRKAKVTAATPPVRVVSETLAATCQVPQRDGSIATIGGTSAPFEVVVDDGNPPKFKIKLH